MKPPKPWERQPGETNPAWEARRIYLHMGPSRSLERVSRECTKHVQLLKRWSKSWNWVSSADAFDRYNEELASDAARRKVEADARAKAEKWLRREDEADECVYNVFIDLFNDIAKMAKVASDPNSKTRPPSPQAKNLLVRCFAMMAPLAREAARDSVDRLRAAGVKPEAPPEGAGAAAPTGGRRLAVLKAFVDYKESEGEGAA